DNDKKNYLITIALSGDQYKKKNNYRTFLTSNTVLMGVSTINFEEAAKKKIYDSLKQVKFSAASPIKQAYNGVGQRIGRLPLLMDFIRQNSIDPSVIYSTDSSYKNYNNFLVSAKQIEEQLDKNE